VVDGVLDVEDVDRAMSVGPGLAWVSSGPHLEHHLAAEAWGVDVYVSQLLGTYEALWKSLADWSALDIEDRKRFIRLIDKAYTPHIPELREARDQRLVRLLEALRE
jgi:hypothetical protein